CGSDGTAAGRGLRNATDLARQARVLGSVGCSPVSSFRLGDLDGAGELSQGHAAIEQPVRLLAGRVGGGLTARARGGGQDAGVLVRRRRQQVVEVLRVLAAEAGA